MHNGEHHIFTRSKIQQEGSEKLYRPSLAGFPSDTMKTFHKLEKVSKLNARSMLSYLMQREHSKSDASTRVVGISLEVTVVFSDKASASR